MTTDPTTARQLREALRRLLVAHGTLDPVRRPCGTQLSTAHAWALLELAADGPLTVTELAERLQIDRTNVSRLCARMEADHELERRPHPTDGRARRVQLTAAGRQLAERVDALSAGHFAGILARLDHPTPAVVDALDALTRAMRTPPSLELP